MMFENATMILMLDISAVISSSVPPEMIAIMAFIKVFRSDQNEDMPSDVPTVLFS